MECGKLDIAGTGNHVAKEYSESCHLANYSLY
jgi:hypothetical protein